MTQHAYEYGQRWAVRLPRNDLRTFVSRIHCAEAADHLLNQVQEICERSKIPVRLIPQCKRYALCVFNQHRDLYKRVLVGNFG